MAEKIEVEDGNPNFNFFAVKKYFFYQKCHNLPQEYTYYKSRGCFRKFRKFANTWAHKF